MLFQLRRKLRPQLLFRHGKIFRTVGAIGLIAGFTGFIWIISRTAVCWNAGRLTILANRTFSVLTTLLRSSCFHIDYPAAVAVLCVTVFLAVVGCGAVCSLALVPMGSFVRSPAGRPAMLVVGWFHRRNIRLIETISGIIWEISKGIVECSIIYYLFSLECRQENQGYVISVRR